jgi:thymidylate synthase (FAD)|nr:MAG TPA: Thymidylate synthase complementing protein [Caudoviricetes sp.]
MKIINAQAFVLVENDPIKKIEKCGRVCYKSEDKITEDSAEKFVANIIKRGHEAVLEHASFIFQVSYNVYKDIRDKVMFVENRYPVKMYLRFTDSDGYVVSGNVRAWRDFFFFAGVPPYMNDFVESTPILFPEFKSDFPFNFKGGKWSIRQISADELVSPYQRLVHEDVSVKFICDRGVTHEIVRHRPASFCQESTRYCNYSSGKFGGEITVIKPCFFKENYKRYLNWFVACESSETAYNAILEDGGTTQEARDVLPNSLKTELIMTAPLMEWCHFFNLRMSPAAHPQMQEVASYAYDAMNSFLWDSHRITLDTCENAKNAMRRIR